MIYVWQRHLPRHILSLTVMRLCYIYCPLGHAPRHNGRQRDHDSVVYLSSFIYTLDCCIKALGNGPYISYQRQKHQWVYIRIFLFL